MFLSSIKFTSFLSLVLLPGVFESHPWPAFLVPKPGNFVVFERAVGETGQFFFFFFFLKVLTVPR